MADEGKTGGNEEVEKERTELIQKLEATGWKYEDDDRFKGLIADNQSERQSRHSSDEELTRLREANSLLSEEIAEKKNPTSGNALEGQDDEAYVTVGSVRKLLTEAADNAETQSKKQNEANDKADFSRRIAAGEDSAKEKFSTATVGEGLDYMSVLEGFKRVAAKNPAYKSVLLNSANPAEEAYRIGLTDPEIAQRVELSTNSRVLAKMKTGGSGLAQVGTGTGSTGGLESLGIEELMSISDEELDKSIKEDEAKAK